MATDIRPARPSDEEAMALLTEMVRTYSPSRQEEAVASLLVNAMNGFGLDACRDEAGNAIGRIGRGTRHVVLLGHMDTFRGELPVRREAGLLYGRGAVDAKGALAAFIVAAARAGPLPDLRITVVGAVEEECETSAGAHYAALQHHPDMAIIGEPSRWNRVTLGYKGVLSLRYRLCRPMAHTAGERPGVAGEAIHFWNRLTGWAQAYNADKTRRFDALDPSLRAIHSGDDALQQWVEMDVAFRLPPGLAVGTLLNQVEVSRGDAQVECGSHEPPFVGGRSNVLCSALLHAIRAEGGKPAFVLKTGTSDMNVVGPVWKCPIVAYGPGDSALDHTPEEHLDLQEYLRSIRVLTLALQRLAGR